MAPIRRQRKSSDTKQRSFHLTDDVYAIVEREAAAAGISNSAWISHMIHTHAGRHTEQPTPRLRAADEPAAPNTEAQRFKKPAGSIVLPDPDVGEFSVDKSGRVHGKRLRSDNELSGVEGGAPKRRGRTNRNEEIDL